MGVYIKNMKMPEDCIKCPLCLFTGKCWKCLADGSHANFGGTCRPPGCPLVPVPPHGRLIDADEVCYQLEKQATIDGQPRAIRRARRIVADAPTIIKAEEE